MDLFVAAVENGPSLEKVFEQTLSGCTRQQAKRLKAFTDRVQRDGRVSINATGADILGFLESGRYKNMYEIAKERSERTGRSVEQILREKLIDYYGRRVRFDGHFDRGEEFRYGALNIGGLGYATLGEYCMVTSQEASDHPGELAYLKSDSLQTEEYWLPDGSVNEPRVRGDLATQSHRAPLAALKHAREIQRRSPSEWPNMVCSEKDYVEGIFVHQLTPTGLEKVRMARSEYRRLYARAPDALAGDAGRGELSAIERFGEIRAKLIQIKVDLEVVDDA